MFRIMIVWVLISLCVGIYRYFFSKTEKKEVKTVAKKTVTSMGIGLIVIFIVMQLNNFSGI